MFYLKKLYAFIVSRILDNPKSSVAGVLALIGYLATVYGFEVSPEITAFVSSALLVLFGLLKKD